MEYEFSWSVFVIGALILAAGAVFLRFHRVIADNLASGVSSYERFKLAGLITCGLGLLVMLNLHILILSWIILPLFGR